MSFPTSTRSLRLSSEYPVLGGSRQKGQLCACRPFLSGERQGGQRPCPSCPLLDGAHGTKEEGLQFAAVCFRVCVSSFAYQSSCFCQKHLHGAQRKLTWMLFLDRVFLSASWCRSWLFCHLSRSQCVIHKGLLLPCPPPHGLRAEGVSSYTLHKPRLQATHQRPILPQN